MLAPPAMQRIVILQRAAVGLFIGRHDMYAGLEPVQIHVGHRTAGTAIDNRCVRQVIGIDMGREGIPVQRFAVTGKALPPAGQVHRAFSQVHARR